jgi:hypothetical protein
MTIYVTGDVHGHRAQLEAALREAELIDAAGAWTGGAAELWFLGDLVDRGPDSLGVIDLVMRLQTEATAAGGQVECLLGNHEVMFLAAYRFRTQCNSWDRTYASVWEFSAGGRPDDLRQVTPEQIAWLAQRPAMALVAGRLLIHADATFYTVYGATIDEVNRAFAALLANDETMEWDRLIWLFGGRFAFTEQEPGDTGVEIAAAFLAQYGGAQLVHGHTPIVKMTGRSPQTIRSPHIYADGLCVNVDGGLHKGGPGFVYRLPPVTEIGQ